MLFGWNQVPCQKYIDRLIAECNRGIEAQQIFQFLCLKSGLLLQFPVSAVNHRLSRIIQLPRRNFQRITVQCIPVLAHHKEFPVMVDSHNCSRTIMMDEIPFCFMTVYINRILVHFQDCSLIFKFSFQPLHRGDILSPHFRPGRKCFFFLLFHMACRSFCLLNFHI